MDTYPPLLYADDSEMDVELFQIALRRAGLDWPLILAANGWEAISRLNEQVVANPQSLPGLILLDKKMPLADGIDVLKWVRERPTFDATPVVMFSTSDLPEDVALAKEHGADAYLVKNANPEDQVKQVLDLLEVMKNGRQGKWLSLPGGVA